MFSWLQNLLRDMTPETKTLFGAVLWLGATVFAVKPAIKAMSEFGNKDWMKALSSVGAVIAIYIIPVIGTVLLVTAGTRIGGDLNNRANVVGSVIPALAIYFNFKINKKQDLV